MKRIYLSIIALALIFSGCEIDRAPYDALTPEDLDKSEGSLQAVTDGNYARLKTMALGWHRVMEFPSDNVSLSGTTTSHLIYLYNYQRIASNSFSTSFWTNSYQIIASSNRILETVPKGKSPASDQLLGENYFLRAYLHFSLVNVFGRPYSHGAENLGVPLKTDANPQNHPARSKVGEVYAQVIRDLETAESLLNVSKPNIYVSKEVVWALLSRVYLYMEDNTKAIEYADKVINSKRYSLVNTATLPVYPTLKPESNSETIWAIKFIPNADLEAGGYSNIGSMYSTIQGVGYGEMYASRTYLELVRRFPTDVRNKFIVPNYLNNGKLVAIYVDNAYQYKSVYVTKVNTDDYSYIEAGTTKMLEKEVNAQGLTEYYITVGGARRKVFVEAEMAARNGYPKYFIIKASGQEGQAQLWSPVVFRLAEMYLIKAEAYAKLGDAQSALANVNIIRTRAGIPTPGLYQADNLPANKTVLDLVLEERQLELAWEGHRKFDVFRNKRDMDRRYPGGHLSGNTPINYIKWADAFAIELIPESQILTHQGLVQNP
ncbi:MAG TPA: RagB/SusD family nutrient uptake outer membrane protein [Daejeonella sp.]